MQAFDKNIFHGFLGGYLLALATAATLVGCAQSHTREEIIQIDAPEEGDVLGSSDDADSGTEGVQFAVEVNTYGIFPGAELMLEHGASSTSLSDTGLRVNLGIDGKAIFPLFTFPGGDNVVRVRAVGGETASVLRRFQVEEVTVSIDAPSDGAILNSSDDCDLVTDGTQIAVDVSTDAPDGSAVSLWLGGDASVDVPDATTSSSAGQASFCVDASEGENITITARVISIESMSEGEDQVTVTIDATAPLSGLIDLSVSYFEDPADSTLRREGQVTFGWTAVDAGGTGSLANLESYALRCSDQPIIEEADWDAAAAGEVALSSVPQASGESESEVVLGFQRLGVSSYCAIRGIDAGGNLTPFGSAAGATGVEVNNPYLTQNVNVGYVSTQIGRYAVVVGDVNGDGVDDTLMTGINFAMLYFGTDLNTANLSNSIGVLFSSSQGVGFGSTVVGLGDFNGDGMNDFAIGDAFENGVAGAVYVFYGRAANDAWPATIDVAPTPTACVADVCYRAAGFAGLGWDLGAGGDLNGDATGLNDLLMTAPGLNSFVGTVYGIFGANIPSGTVVTLPTDDPDGFVINGPGTNNFFGASISGVGDHNGDGRGDFLTVASGIDNVDPTPDVPAELYFVTGAAYTGPGLEPLTTGALVFQGSVYREFEAPLRNVGDIDGDGDTDVAVYLLTSDSSGGARVFLGDGGTYSAASVLAFTNDGADSVNDEYGLRIGASGHAVFGSLGDYDGDGLADLGFGSGQSGTGSGTASFFYGQTPAVGRPRSEADLVFNNAGGLSTGVASVGDLNNDGSPDFAVLSGGGMVVYY